MAEEPPQSEIHTSLDGLYGAWVVCSAYDDMTFLVLHEDQTFEAYDAWQLDPAAQTGNALMLNGSFTFDAATGALALEGKDVPYTLKTVLADAEMESGDGMASAPAGTKLLLLDAPLDEEGWNASSLYLPLTDGFPLVPTQARLSAEEDVGWYVSAEPHYAEDMTQADEYFFHADGTAELVSGGEKSALTYAVDNGRLTLTLADGTTREALLQYAILPLADAEAENIAAAQSEDDDQPLNLDEVEYDDDPEPGLYDVDAAYDHGWNAAMSQYIIRVTELENGKPGAVSYLLIEGI